MIHHYENDFQWLLKDKLMDNNKILTRTETIEKILAAELRMFQSVPAIGANRCLEHPEEFKQHREAQFSIFSNETLKSYLDDIKTAQEKGQNLMTDKYARMDNLIPKTNCSTLVDAVAAIMVNWQIQLIEKYPGLMERARPVASENDDQYKTSFETYIKGELETYSESTLSFLQSDLKKLQVEGKNGSEEIYRYLILGRQS